MIEYLEEALDFYLGEITVGSEGDPEVGPGPSITTDSKPELRLWEVEP